MRGDIWDEAAGSTAKDEVVGAFWTEISDTGQLWTIPGARTRDDQAHHVRLQLLPNPVYRCCPILLGVTLYSAQLA